MQTDPRTLTHLPHPDNEVGVRRPLIGVTMGRERSQRYFGLPMYIMNQTYVRALENRGALPVLIPLNMSESTLRGIFENLDGLFLPGGEDMDPATYAEERGEHLGPVDQERDRTELLLTRWALETGMPILGVCRGIQVINVCCGGTLYQDLHHQRPDLEKHDFFPPTYERFRISHEVRIEADSRLALDLGTTHAINSMHHQGIKQLGVSLRTVAHAPDGLPEAIECPTLPFVVAVQWHPEELAKTDEYSAGLFGSFIAAAGSDWQADVPTDWLHKFHALLADGPAGRAPINPATSAQDAPVPVLNQT